MITVNFSTEGYKNGQNRLKNSLGEHKNLMFTTYQEIGSPSQKEAPYFFKIAAIEKAFQKSNEVLWADASMYLVGDLSKIEKIIQETGFYGEEAGHYAGRWTNKFTRKYFNATEDEMKQEPGGITLFSAGLLGLSKSHPVAVEFFRQWKAAGEAGCFVGDWADHRHDMTCASIIATRLGLKYQAGGSHMAYVGEGYGPPNPDVVFYAQGML